MTTPRYYGLPRPGRITMNSNGMATVAWTRPFLTPPCVSLVVENPSTTQAAFADVLAGSVTTTGAVIRAWRTQNVIIGGSTVAPYAGAVVHVTPSGDLA